MINFKHIDQSSWLGDYLNKYFPDKGTFVEIGVGNIISRDFIFNEDKYSGSKWDELPILGSNTIELLQNGWMGYYIDPEESFIKQAILLAPDKNKIKTAIVGCGNREDVIMMGDGESFKSKSYDLISNGWVGKFCNIKVTNDVFKELEIPKKFEFLGIDVEGFEEEVLQGLDLNYYTPFMIFIEINKVPLDIINNYLGDKYDLVNQDGLNSLFILK
jgi:hypothetical protein